MAIENNPFVHILYEFSMYLQATICCSDEQFINNLLIDSRMVHLRNIIYFFSPKYENNHRYMHYARFITTRLPREVDHSLLKDTERICSNATCHLQNGRLNA